MAAWAATFVVRRDDIPRLEEAARSASVPAFKQTLGDCMVGQGDGLGSTGYTLVYLLSYLRSNGIWQGSEYARVEHAFGSVAAVGGYLMTPRAFSNVDDLDPRRHHEGDIDLNFAQLGVTSHGAGMDGKQWLGILHEKVGALREDQALLVLVG